MRHLLGIRYKLLGMDTGYQAKVAGDRSKSSDSDYRRYWKSIKYKEGELN